MEVPNIGSPLVKKKKSTILVNNVDNGKSYSCVGVRSIWETSVPLHFAVNLKLFLKNVLKQNTWLIDVYTLSRIFNFDKTDLH